MAKWLKEEPIESFLSRPSDIICLARVIEDLHSVNPVKLGTRIVSLVTTLRISIGAQQVVPELCEEIYRKVGLLTEDDLKDLFV